MIRVALSAVALAAAVPVVAQIPFTPDPAPIPAAFGPSFGDAVAATIQAHLEARGLGAQAPYVIDQARQTLAGCCGGGSTTQPVHWLQYIKTQARKFGWFPLPLFQGYGSVIPEGFCFGAMCNKPGQLEDYSGLGPGVPGPLDCITLKLPDVPAGEDGYMVPSIPLAGGTPIREGDITYYDSVGRNPFPFDMGIDAVAAAIWSIHHQNMGLQKPRWAGYHAVEYQSNGRLYYRGNKPPYYDPVTGAFVFSSAIQTNIQRNDQWDLDENGFKTTISEPCPEGDGGSDFHFYSHWENNRTTPNYNNQNGCTWYKPNFQLSVTGYAYPEFTYVRNETNASEAVRGQVAAATCGVSEWAVRVVADRMFRAATGRTGYSGPEYLPIEPAHVRVSGGLPFGSSLSRSPSADFPASSPVSPPTVPQYPDKPVGYVPPPTGAPGGGDPGGNQNNQPPVDVTHPVVDEPDWTAPEVSMPDWLPDFASLVVPQGSGDCPLFGFDAFGERHELTQHCTMIEDYRLTIASIMLVVFAFMAYTIVLRA